MDYSLFDFNNPVYVSDLDDTFKVRQIKSASIYYNNDFEVYFDIFHRPIASVNYTRVIPKNFVPAMKSMGIAKKILTNNEITSEKLVRAINYLASYKSSIAVLGDFYSTKQQLIDLGLICIRTNYSHRTNASISNSFWINYSLIKAVRDDLVKLIQASIGTKSSVTLTPEFALLNGVFRRYEALLMHKNLDMYKFRIRQAKDGQLTGRATSLKYTGLPSFYNNGKGMKNRPDYPLSQCRQAKLIQDEHLKGLDDITVFDQKCSIPHLIQGLNGITEWSQEDLYNKMLPHTEAALGKLTSRADEKLIVLKVNFRGSEYFNKSIRDSIEDIIGRNKYGTSVFAHEAFMYMFVNIELIRRGYKFLNFFDGWEFYGNKIPSSKEMESILEDKCNKYFKFINESDLTVINEVNDYLPTWSELNIQERSFINSITTKTEDDKFTVSSAIQWYKFKEEILDKGIKYDTEYYSRQLELTLGLSKFKGSRYYKYFKEVDKGVYKLDNSYIELVVDEKGNLLVSEDKFLNNKKFVKRYKEKLNLESRIKVCNRRLKLFYDTLDQKIANLNVRLSMKNFIYKELTDEALFNDKFYKFSYSDHEFGLICHNYYSSHPDLMNTVKELPNYFIDDDYIYELGIPRAI